MFKFFFSNSMHLKKFFFKQRFIYLIFWSRWIFVTALGLSLVIAAMKLKDAYSLEGKL